MQQITPGQALLMLMDIHKNDPEAMDELRKLYLTGRNDKNIESDTLMGKWLAEAILDPAFEKYEIVTDAQHINEDPSRRYFETHLAYETLKDSLKNLSLQDLAFHQDTLLRHLIEGDQPTPPEILQAIKTLSTGKTPVLPPEFSYRQYTFNEFASVIEKIHTGEYFPQASAEEKLKLQSLMMSALLGVANAWYRASELPLDIYGRGEFSEESRGRLGKETPYTSRETQGTTRSQNLGIMRSYMPTPQDDVARAEKTFPQVRSGDNSNFNPAQEISPDDPTPKFTAQGVQETFSSLVKPFSNSISGTMLCQLRAMKKLLDNDFLSFDQENQFKDFIKSFSSILLYSTGGHSFHEFLSPLFLPEIQEAFNSVPGIEKMKDESAFVLEGNQPAFDRAVKDTIAYNEILLKRQNLHATIATLASKTPEQIAAKLEDMRTELLKTTKEDKDSPVGIFMDVIDELILYVKQTEKPDINYITAQLGDGYAQNYDAMSEYVMYGKIKPEEATMNLEAIYSLYNSWGNFTTEKNTLSTSKLGTHTGFFRPPNAQMPSQESNGKIKLKSEISIEKKKQDDNPENALEIKTPRI